MKKPKFCSIKNSTGGRTVIQRDSGKYAVFSAFFI